MSFVLRSSLIIATLAVAGCAAFWEVPGSPLSEAAWRGDLATVRQLVAAGRDVNAPDDLGETPIYWAAQGGHRLGPHQCGHETTTRPELIAALVDLGANPNIRDRRPQGFGRSSGWTPLMVALHHQQFRTAAMLLEKGADPNIRSDQNMSAMDMAKAEGAPQELIDLLLAKGFKG